jgi:hypothetical protein
MRRICALYGVLIPIESQILRLSAQPDRIIAHLNPLIILQCHCDAVFFESHRLPEIVADRIIDQDI